MNKVKMAKQFQIDFASFEEEYIRSYIALADAKAGVIFTLVSGVIGYLLIRDEVGNALIDPACWLEFMSAAVPLILLGLGAFFSFSVIAPRLKSSPIDGLVFFGGVAQKESADAYIDEVLKKTEQQIFEIRLAHCYDIAVICDKKYKYLKRSIWVVGMSLVSAIPFLLMNVDS